MLHMIQWTKATFFKARVLSVRSPTNEAVLERLTYCQRTTVCNCSLTCTLGVLPSTGTECLCRVYCSPTAVLAAVSSRIRVVSPHSQFPDNLAIHTHSCAHPHICDASIMPLCFPLTMRNVAALLHGNSTQKHFSVHDIANCIRGFAIHLSSITLEIVVDHKHQTDR